MKHTCLVCNQTADNETFTAKEILTGRGDSFEYFICSHCGSTQIVEVPANLADYYATGYYSFASPKPRLEKIRRLVDSARTDAAMGIPNLLGSLLNLVARPMKYLTWIKEAGLTKQSKILDVGSGSGSVVYKMSLGGFDVTGIDPFVSSDTEFSTGARVLKCDIHELARRAESTYDLIMFHHSLEHSLDPVEQLRSARRILNEHGTVLVRVPVAGGYSQNKYREHWFHLHPPLHMFVPSLHGMEMLAERSGYRIPNRWFESEASHIANCELIARGVALSSKKASSERFTSKELRAFDTAAKTADAAEKGDQAVFILSHLKTRDCDLSQDSYSLNHL